MPRPGKVIWSAKNGNPKIGETNTNAPHVFKDKVITGISGGEFGVRGRLIAYDIKTGKTGSGPPGAPARTTICSLIPPRP